MAKAKSNVPVFIDPAKQAAEDRLRREALANSRHAPALAELARLISAQRAMVAEQDESIRAGESHLSSGAKGTRAEAYRKEAERMLPEQRKARVKLAKHLADLEAEREALVEKAVAEWAGGGSASETPADPQREPCVQGFEVVVEGGIWADPATDRSGRRVLVAKGTRFRALLHPERMKPRATLAVPNPQEFLTGRSVVVSADVDVHVSNLTSMVRTAQAIPIGPPERVVEDGGDGK